MTTVSHSDTHNYCYCALLQCCGYSVAVMSELQQCAYPSEVNPGAPMELVWCTSEWSPQLNSIWSLKDKVLYILYRAYLNKARIK